MSQTVLSLVALLAVYMNEPTQFQPKPKTFLREQILSMKAGVIAYRGGALEAPENSLEAIQQALQLQVQGVHFDIRKTADQQEHIFVLAAEDNLQRVTGQEVHVKDTLYADLPPLQETIVSEFGEEFVQVQQNQQKTQEENPTEVRIPTFEQVAQLFVDNDALLVVQDHTLNEKDSYFFLKQVESFGLLSRLVYQTEKTRWTRLQARFEQPIFFMESSAELQPRFEEFVTGQFQQQQSAPETDLHNTTFAFKTVQKSPEHVQNEVLSTWTSRQAQQSPLQWPENLTFSQFAEYMEEYKPYVQLMNFNYQNKARVPVSYFPVNYVEDYELARELACNLVFTERPAELMTERYTQRWEAQQWTQRR